MSDRNRWAVGSNQYVKRPGAAQRNSHRAGPAGRLDAVGANAQLELLGIRWDADEVDLSLMQPSSVERARHRFRAALPDLVWNAAALEGNTFTLPEVRTLLDGVTVGGKRLDEERQVLALSEGYSLVDELAGAGEFRIDKATSDRVHGIVAQQEAIESGHFRGEGQVSGGGSVRLSSGGSVEGVPADELPGRWQRLMDGLADIDDVRLRALAFNAAATRTQYYFDGNKRTARLMTAGALLSAGYDAINVPYARLLEYNLALDDLFTTDDATPLMAFLVTTALR